ncbi:alpha-ketoacid dehydrogenase kinase [Gonapodya prolifera JEL478]|uniref:Protein-serine/threonine kinase n=1 Tax=Gonapodya prolifera (strain JEL478) TaxID=1344416 RepID=A0A139AI70_GONPJ|nr:alpha-ketoacid dehydrogenase kinase [Gonapodya prolifera JEL478]|eukprot:KXS16511.1 alpha-ketoacid dehydrogenase kinase [Gonapodya prolifera JEL478]
MRRGIRALLRPSRPSITRPPYSTALRSIHGSHAPNTIHHERTPQQPSSYPSSLVQPATASPYDQNSPSSDFIPTPSNPYPPSSASFDSKLAFYASQPLAVVTLRDLLRIGAEAAQAPKGDEVHRQKLVESAKFMRSEIPKRLARRVRALESLPFIVGLNPYIKSVYNLYRWAFEKVADFPQITDYESDLAFSDILAELVEAHTDVVPRLAKGFLESERYWNKEDIATWLDKMIWARIAIRVLAEHHHALHEPHPNWIGIVNTRLRPSALLRTVVHHCTELCEANYGTVPDVIVSGDPDISFAYIPVHLEYMLTELIKNAMRATVEHSRKLAADWENPPNSGYVPTAELPPVEVTISRSTDVVTIRVRDTGGGVPYADYTRVFDYNYTTVPRDDEEAAAIALGRQGAADPLAFAGLTKTDLHRGIGGPMAGLGFGLPMTRLYARYFGGDLEFKSVYGWGADLFLRLRDVGGVGDQLRLVDSSN